MKLWFPVDALLVSQLAHDGAGTAYGLEKHLKQHPAVRTRGAVSSFEKAWVLIKEGKVNMIFIAPYIENDFWTGADDFIAAVREQYPKICFVLYTTAQSRLKMIERKEKFKHYYFLEEIFASPLDSEDDLPRKKVVDELMKTCDKDWYPTRTGYDIGISYAGKDRHMALALVTGLQQLPQNRVFFDKNEEAGFLGKDLYNTLADVYTNKCRYGVVIISTNYTTVWTKHEQQAMETRALNEHDYIISIIVDGTKIPGLTDASKAFLAIEKGIDEIVRLLNKKLWVDGTQQKHFIGTALY